MGTASGWGRVVGSVHVLVRERRHQPGLRGVVFAVTETPVIDHGSNALNSPSVSEEAQGTPTPIRRRPASPRAARTPHTCAPGGTLGYPPPTRTRRRRRTTAGAAHRPPEAPPASFRG